MKSTSPKGLSRRDIVISAGLAMAFPGLAGAKVTAQSKGAREDLELWYEKPAGPWVEALPVGNGYMGAMVFGRVAQERIQLNEMTLSAGGPYDPVNPAMLDALPKVRALIDAGKFKEASDLADRDMIAKPRSQMPYGAAGDIFLDFKGLSQPSAYRRSLALDSAIASAQFTCGKARYTREIFASTPDNVVVVRLTADRGTLDFDIGYRHPRDVKMTQADYNGSGKSFDLAGAAWDKTESLERDTRPQTLGLKPDGATALLIEGRNAASAGIDGALRYAVRVAAIGDGAIAAKDDRIEVRGARTVTLVIAAATSYVNFRDTSGDPVSAVRTRSDAATRKPYSALKAGHMAAHRALFRRLSIRLGDGTDSRSTNQRIATAETAPDPALAALYVQYARYLLISSSRPGGQPANLQGMWNEGNNPPWGSKYTININTEMNYWPAGPANLAECVEPVLRMVEDLAITGAETARKGYNARGWVAHHNTDLWRATAPIDGAPWGMWPMGGAWLCMTLWDHYEYTSDPALLKRLYPLLKGASLFFVDALVEDPKGRGLVTSPSISPENTHPGGVSICAGPAMDRQILRDLFGTTLRAHALAKDPDTDFARTLQEKRVRLPADRIGAQGQLQEWLDDWDAEAPEQQHRHVSHLYGVYPSGQINVRDTPDLINAAKTTLNVRGDKSTGWATAWRLALWARMGEGDRAHSILLGLLGPSRTYPNMFDAHPPFQIDGNFGGTAGILEMIVQSWGDEIRLLPALPSAWPDGSLHGVRARGGIELDIDWSGGKLKRASLRGTPGTRVAVRYAGTLKSLSLDARGAASFI
jgi:alpha-L-fucosidase 2